MGIDIATTFIRAAAQLPVPGVHYALASMHQLPFAARSFDFATACMSLMDVPQPVEALREAARVLVPGGFLQFSIAHPCSNTPHRRQVKDAGGRPYALETGGYFERTAGLRKFRVPRFHRPLSEWLNMVAECGFRIERCIEPAATDAVLERFPKLADTRIAPYFLHLRCRNPPDANRGLA